MLIEEAQARELSRKRKIQKSKVGKFRKEYAEAYERIIKTLRRATRFSDRILTNRGSYHLVQSRTPYEKDYFDR